jgi:hypothetical protein
VSGHDDDDDDTHFKAKKPSYPLSHPMYFEYGTQILFSESNITFATVFPNRWFNAKSRGGKRTRNSITPVILAQQPILGEPQFSRRPPPPIVGGIESSVASRRWLFLVHVSVLCIVQQQ